jgi:hypothetical protein
VVKLKALDTVLRVRENAELAAKLQAVRSTIGYISIGIIGMCWLCRCSSFQHH